MKGLLANKEVAIIGPGPVGLTMARLLQNKGICVKVYERDTDEQARVSGGTLDIHKDTGQLAFQEAGLLEAFYNLSVPTNDKAADTRGNILFSKAPARGEEYFRPEIDRFLLRKMLLDSLDKNTVCWNRKFLSVETIKGNSG